MRLILACALALAALVGPAIAREITPAEDREIPYSAAMPACYDPGVLKRITAAFAESELRFWNSALTIEAYDKIRPVAFRPWGLDTIPRRYCTATATISDGRKHRIDYSVREDLGFIGGGFGVEWCVVGLDRNWAYAPHCKMARP